MTHRITMKRLPFLLVVALLLAHFSFVPGNALHGQISSGLQADSGPTMCLTELPVISAYPDVQINFRMFDPSFVPMASITDQQIRISENGHPALPLNTNMQRNTTKGGIDFYFVVDRGNRADQSAIRTILQEFANYFQEGVDTVTIYTDTNNGVPQYYPSSKFSSLAQAIANYPEKSEDNVRSIHAALDKLSTQFIDADPCAMPRVIYFILGDGTFNQTRSGHFAEIAKTAHAKIALLHLSNIRDGSFEYKALYEDSVMNAKGIYKQILSPSDDARVVFDQLAPYRQVYTANYRTNTGESGSHNIQAEYLGTNIPTAGHNSYAINLLPPKINLASESVVTRNAIERIDGGFSYDQDAQDITVNVTWPDGYARQLASSATLIISGQTAEELRIPISISGTGNNIYKFSWNFATIQERGQHDNSLSLEVIDEFGIVGKTESAIQITILNTVSPTIYFKSLNWLLYVMAGLIITLLIAIIVVWRRVGNLAMRGGQVISKIAGEIRKTLVGGGRKGKALATLKVVDGPASLVGEELKIFTEKVSLGRDPKQADLTFYTADTNSSISGLHAILERVNGAWRLVAVSQSRSETFLDNHAIPFDDPVYINPGQQVRLGYPAQQPVVFEFQTTGSSKTEMPDLRKTDVGDNTTPIGLIKINKDKEQKLKQDSVQEKNSLFDEYLD